MCQARQPQRGCSQTLWYTERQDNTGGSSLSLGFQSENPKKSKAARKKVHPGDWLKPLGCLCLGTIIPAKLLQRVAGSLLSLMWNRETCRQHAATHTAISQGWAFSRHLHLGSLLMLFHHQRADSSHTLITMFRCSPLWGSGAYPSHALHLKTER